MRREAVGLGLELVIVLGLDAAAETVEHHGVERDMPELVRDRETRSRDLAGQLVPRVEVQPDARGLVDQVEGRGGTPSTWYVFAVLRA